MNSVTHLVSCVPACLPELGQSRGPHDKEVPELLNLLSLLSNIATNEAQKSAHYYTVRSESHCALTKGVGSMSTSVYTNLNPFNFIRKHFLQICL
jgi:hypothetical protein